MAKGEVNPDGSPAWVLHDELSGRYFRLGQLQMELLSYVDGRTADQIVEAMATDLQHHVDVGEVEELFRFLRANNLVDMDALQHEWRRQQLANKPGLASRLLMSYLSFRVPLWRPDRFLRRTLRYVAWLGQPRTLAFIGALGFMGLVLAMQNFAGFTGTFLYFFNLQGFVYFTIALSLVKVLHEFGHAYATVATGCKVPVMGVSFIVMWPVLYTDTSDAWRLESRRKRLMIDAAGVIVELSLAALALLLWSVLDDGVLRSVCFVLATSTWVLSLGINLNPLMRFDGYYLLSDYWRMPNLEQRSQALSRWWLREFLFGLGEQPPESPQLRLIGYAMAVWVYRLLLFTGIALVVYHMFFKVMGLAMFSVEIVYFLVAPIWREVKRWISLHQRLVWNFQTKRSVALLATLLAIFLVPWRGTVTLPAIYQATYHTIYASAAGQVGAMHASGGQQVASGELLLQLVSPELAFDLRQAQHKLVELQFEQSSVGIDATARKRALVSSSEMETQQQRVASLQAKVNRLRIVAPEAGYLTDIDPGLKEGMWVAEGAPLLALVNPQAPRLFAYADENQLSRLQTGQQGTFYPQGGGRSPFDIEVSEVEFSGVPKMEQLYSASVFGGNVAVRKANNGDLIPVNATYRIRMQPMEPPVVERVLRGTVKVSGPSQSLVVRAWLWAASSLLRESGF